MEEGIERARVARLHVLAEMAKTISEPRKELSKYRAAYHHHQD
jgi:polyribonucleotide nucleotidyltransferase